MKKSWGHLKAWLLGNLVFWVFKALSSTWKLVEDPFPPEIEEAFKKGLPVVACHWHEDEWSLLAFFAKRKVIVLVSLSEDGSAMTVFLRKLGFQVLRGSSSRGGVGGLRALIRTGATQQDKLLSLAVDGPRGPRRRPKNGVFKLSQTLEAPLLIGAAAANRAWVFKKAWSKAFIPKPFSTVHLSYVPSLGIEEVRRGVERDDFAALSCELEERLKNAKKMAQNEVLIRDTHT